MRHGQATVDQLLQHYKAERDHSDYVCRLALQIFDAVASEFHLETVDRTMLEFAARLHDLAYAVKPKNHAVQSALLLRKNGLHGVSSDELEIICSTIALHRRKYKKHLQFSLCTSRTQRHKSLQLAAILRIADGLDHSHLQDASIQDIRCSSDQIELIVQQPWYKNNLNWSKNKADLWSEIYPVPLAFIGVELPPNAMRYGGIPLSGTNTAQACRRLLMSQYRLCTDNISGAIAGTDECYLHDLRVALRRLRMIFRFFKPLIPDDKYTRFTDGIKNITAQLGSIRDAQVWTHFLTQNHTSASSKIKTFIDKEIRAEKALLPQLKNILTAPATLALLQDIALAVRCDLSWVNSTENIETYAAKKLLKLTTHVHRLPKITGKTTSEQAHHIRKEIRKARYYAEIAEPLLGSCSQDYTVNLTALADALGSFHDMDMYLLRITRIPKTPASIRRHINTERDIAYGQYKTCLKKLNNPDFIKALNQEIRHFKKKALP